MADLPLTLATELCAHDIGASPLTRAVVNVHLDSSNLF